MSCLGERRCEKGISRTVWCIKERMEKHITHRRKSLGVTVFYRISSGRLLLDPKSFHKTVAGR
jgi:hypothetical protein